MTQPEKEFELKPPCWGDYDGNKVWIVGPSQQKIGEWVCEQENEMLRFVVSLRPNQLKPWNPDPKPKSFEDERGALANDVVVLAENNRQGKDAVYMSMAKMLDIAARISALQPDAPAAAVAGSADIELIASEIAECADPAGDDNCIYRVSFHTLRRWASKLRTVSPSPPLPNPAAFNEAAERKLFEAEAIGKQPLDRVSTGQYAYQQAEAAWLWWLASAKVQRGAVPAVVAEVRKELMKLTELKDPDCWCGACSIRRSLTRIAAKLGVTE